MQEENYIQEKVGKRNPFQVPEGYFDDFASRMMASLPEREVRRAKTVRMRPFYYAAAASVCALFVSAAVWLWQSPSDKTYVSQAQSTEMTSEDAFDAAADYAMIDNQTIYACLAEEIN